MTEKKVINNFHAGSNCQVFNGPISGCNFVMPGGVVNQQPMQQVSADGEVTQECNQKVEDGLLFPIPEGLAEEIVTAPAHTFSFAENKYMIGRVQEAGALCKEPWHFACLMAVCDDYGILVDRTALTDFARTMVAWGIVELKEEGTVKRLANSMRHTMEKLPLRYKEWGNELKAYRNKCEALAQCFGTGMEYKYK